MPTNLGEMQFEILPFEDAEQGVPFGIGCPVSIDSEGFKPGGPEWYTEDVANPVNGATLFGNDIVQGTTWQWDMHVNRDRTGNALDSLEELAGAWRADQIRDSLGAALALRYRIAGRVRRVFGRPRRFEYSPSNLILGGYCPISADFKCVDSYTYDDLETTVQLGLALEAAPGGGLVFPTIFPSTLRPPGVQYASGVVSGTAGTYPVIRFEGPVANPGLQVSGAWGFKLNVDLAAGEYVELDTRPWAQTVLRNGDTSVAEALGPRQWLSSFVLQPGPHDFTFTGEATTPGAVAEVRWRGAWNAL